MSDHNDWAARREASKKARKKNAVLKYLVILFAAAFVLLLYSFLAQQRSNQAAIENLEQTSDSAVQTLENIIAERDELKEQNQELQTENASLHYDWTQSEKKAQEAEQRAKTAEAQTAALNQLNQLRTLYNKKYFRDARKLLDQWEQENPGMMEFQLKQIADAMTEEERSLYDPLHVYQNLIRWVGWEQA